MKYHYCDVIMIAMVSHITRSSIVYSTVCLGADQRKHQSSVLLAFVRWIHQWPVNSPHNWPVTRKCSYLMTSSSAYSFVIFICRKSCLFTLCSWEEFSESPRCHCGNCMIRLSLTHIVPGTKAGFIHQSTANKIKIIRRFSRWKAILSRTEGNSCCLFMVIA